MGDEKPVVTYDFDLPFQRRLLAAASEDAKWLKVNREVIQPEFFTDELLSGVAGSLLALHEHSPVSDLPALLEEIKDHVAPGRKWQEYVDEARRVWKCRGINPEYYRKQASAFARRQAVARAVEQSSQHLELGEYDQIETLVLRALRVGSAGTGGYDYFAKSGERVKSYLESGETRAGAVPTGFGPLDRRTKGGLRAGEVGCILGLAGRGKSSTLISLAGNNLMSGRKVLHVSLENSVEVTAEKYDTYLFGKPIETIRKLPKTFRRHLLGLREKFQSSLEILFFPQDSLSVSAFGAAIAGAKVRPDLVILDYGTLLKSGSKREDKRHELTDIWKGIKRTSGECGVPIWSAHQANRVGVQSALLGMEHSAEFFDIVGIVDVMGSVNWDEERPSEGTLYFFKNRLGKCGFQIPCSVDWPLSKIRPLSDE